MFSFIDFLKNFLKNFSRICRNIKIVNSNIKQQENLYSYINCVCLLDKLALRLKSISVTKY